MAYKFAHQDVGGYPIDLAVVLDMLMVVFQREATLFELITPVSTM